MSNGELREILESIKAIKLTGGIFGKTSLLLIVLCVCVAAVAFKIDVWWVQLALMLPLMAIIVYALKRNFDFAEKNPQAAIMDGAQLLVHERIVHGRKGHDVLPPLQSTIDHEPPVLQHHDIETEDPPSQLALPKGSELPQKEGN